MKFSLKRFFILYKKKTPLLIAAALVLVFIWSQSLSSVSESSAESGWITDHIINPILGLVGLSVNNNFIRKCAHVTEYLVISVIISLIWDCKPVESFYSSFSIAFIDETIQMLSKRGSAIIDVWIDLIGVTLGYGIALYLFLRKRRNAPGGNTSHKLQ